MDTPRFINALEAAAGFRSAKNGMFSERKDIAEVIAYAQQGIQPGDVAFMNTVIAMTVNTLLENVALMLESAEDERVEYDHSDTCMMIAMILEDDQDKSGTAYRNPDVRSWIWLQAKLFDEAWMALPEEMKHKNDRPFDLEILPDLMREFPRVDGVKVEDVTAYLVRWIDLSQAEYTK